MRDSQGEVEGDGMGVKGHRREGRDRIRDFRSTEVNSPRGRSKERRGWMAVTRGTETPR